MRRERPGVVEKILVGLSICPEIIIHSLEATEFTLKWKFHFLPSPDRGLIILLSSIIEILRVIYLFFISKSLWVTFIFSIKYHWTLRMESAEWMIHLTFPPGQPDPGPLPKWMERGNVWTCSMCFYVHRHGSAAGPSLHVTLAFHTWPNFTSLLSPFHLWQITENWIDVNLLVLS